MSVHSLKRPELTAEKQQEVEAARVKREADESQRAEKRRQFAAEKAADFERRKQACLKHGYGAVIRNWEELLRAEAHHEEVSKRKAYENSPEGKAEAARQKREQQENRARWQVEQQARDREERAQLAVRDAANARREQVAAEAGLSEYDRATGGYGNTVKTPVSGDARRAALLVWEKEKAIAKAAAAKAVRNAGAPTVFPDPVLALDLLKRELKPVIELVPGMIEKGIVNCIDGPGGSHKSRLALQIALGCQAGVEMFGVQLMQCQAVFLSSEDHVDEVHRRMAAMAKRLELPVENSALIWDLTTVDSYLVEVTENGIIELPFLSVLVQRLKAIKGHKFLVFDSQYDFIKFVGKAKIDETAVNGVFKGPLTKLCQVCDCTLLIIRHPSRSGISDGTMEGWSVANTNSIRSRLSLAPHRKVRDAYTLRVEKRNHGPAGKEWQLFYTEGCLLPRDSMDAAAQQAVTNAAIVTVAIEEAVEGRPINAKGGFTDTQLEKFREATGGFPITKGQVLDVLRDCSGVGKPLVKIESSSRHIAGFFPSENGDEISRRLKRNEK